MISINNEMHKFCVSWVTIKVIATAITTFVHAWNSHRPPGSNGGIPYELAACTRQTRMLLPQLVPSAAQAVTPHENAEGCLVHESPYKVTLNYKTYVKEIFLLSIHQGK